MWQQKSVRMPPRVVPEVPPVEREAVGVERPLRGGAEPEVVVAARRAGRASGGLAQAAAVGGHPDPRLADLAQHARADDLDDPVIVLAGVDQVAHLGDALGLLGRVDHRPALGDPVRQRLLAIDVLAGLAGEDGRDRVPVVGRGDDDGVDVLAVEHLAEVARRRRASAGRRLGPEAVGLVHVADGGDRDVGELLEDVEQARSPSRRRR